MYIHLFIYLFNYLFINLFIGDKLLTEYLHFLGVNPSEWQANALFKSGTQYFGSEFKSIFFL